MFNIHKYWTCPHCGGTLQKNDDYLECEDVDCVGFMLRVLREAPIPHDLPLAEKYDYKRYTIDGLLGLWEYAVGAHKKALDKKPGPGIVLARVNTEKAIRVRAFRISDMPRRNTGH